MFLPDRPGIRRFVDTHFHGNSVHTSSAPQSRPPAPRDGCLVISGKDSSIAMGCAASKTSNPPPPSTAEPVPKPVAFEIPIAETEEAKASKKPPAQLLQRLEEQAQNNITVEELKEKQQKAEERRQEILEEKCRVARQSQKIFNKTENQNGDAEEKEES